MIWSNILELLINFKLEFATLAFNMTPFGPYGFYKQVNNSGQLEFKSLKLVSVNNGVGLCYETPNEVVVFIGNVLPPNSNNDIYLADTPEDVADIPTEGLNAGDLVYIISTESYQSWDGDSWEDYTPGEALIPPLADVLDQGNTSGPNDIIFDALQGLQFNNSSKLREGTTNAGLGGNKGVAQVCSLDYELKWEAGRLYVMEQDGTTIRQSLYNFTTTPTATDDSSLGYAIGSLWTLDDGTTYECIDATATSADWIKTSQSKFIEITKAQLLALEGLGTLSVNVWYKITDALGSTAKILVSATSVSIVSKSAVNLTDGTFGQYTLNADTYVAIIGTGDVVGPASSVNNQIALFNGTTGKVIKDSGVLLSAKQDTLTAGNMHTYVDSLTALTTPADADRMIIVDNSASLAKKITWANIKTTLASTFQAVLTAANFGTFLTGLTAKNTLVDADEVVSSDSAASSVAKKTTWLNVWTNYIKVKSDALYQATGLAMLKANNGSDIAAIATFRANIGQDKITNCGDAIYTILSTDKAVVTNATFTSSRTWTLPAANSVNAGYEIIVADLFGGVSATNTLVIARAGSDTINGATSQTIAAQYAMRRLFSDGVSKWTFDGGLMRISDYIGTTLTASVIVGTDINSKLQPLSTATYPSLTELAYVKGVTNAIQTQINARRKTLQSTGLGAVVSGNTNITLSKSILIPANTFVAGDIPKVTTRILKTGAVGSYTPRMYLNTTNNLNSAILVGTGYVGTNVNFASGMERVISIEAATGANTFVHNTTTAIGLECINYTGSESTLTIDWTQDQYLMVAIQLTSAVTDTANCRYILIN